MLNKLLIVFLFLVTGCVSNPSVPSAPTIKVEVQRVEVPIAMPCKAEIPKAPDFNFNKIRPENDIFEKTKALLADIKLHIGYEEELTAALKSCK
jgi:hypothetical protein